MLIAIFAGMIHDVKYTHDDAHHRQQVECKLQMIDGDIVRMQQGMASRWNEISLIDLHPFMQSSSPQHLF